MFLNSFGDSIAENRVRFECAKSVYETMIDLELDKVRSVDEADAIFYLEDIFPRAFVQRDPARARQILDDLEDIIKSNVVRDELPPLYLYAAYRLILDFEEDLAELGKAFFFRKEHVRLTQEVSKAAAKEFYVWLDNLSDDFLEEYDDEFVWLDYWEYTFADILAHPEEYEPAPEVEDMAELMPNDFYLRWKRCKAKNQFASGILANLLNFKNYIENTAYEVFQKQPFNEELCRTLVQTYLSSRGFREAHMGGGRCDLVYPSENTVIETKLWRGKQYFEDGLKQLRAYLRAQEYTIGYYLTFYRGANHEVRKAYPEEVFPIHRDGGPTIYCFMICVDPVAPSRKGEIEREEMSEE